MDDQWPVSVLEPLNGAPFRFHSQTNSGRLQPRHPAGPIAASDRRIVAAQAPPARLERLVLLDSWPGLVPVLSLWRSAPSARSLVWALFPSACPPPSGLPQKDHIFPEDPKTIGWHS